MKKNGIVIRQFSGVYKVTQCDHSFQSGQFKQTLTLLRLNAQAELDFKNKAPENKPAVEDSKTSYKMDQPGMWT